jgi:penicillin-binding protein 2
MSYRRRLAALAVAFALAFGALVARLAKVQLLEHEHYARLVNDTHRRLEPVRPRRGTIFDRKGRALARDEPVYRLAIELEDLDPGTEVPVRIARILRRPRGELEGRWRELEAAAARAPESRAALAIATAPSPASAREFGRLAREVDGLSLEGHALLVAPRLLLQRRRVIERIARLTGLDEEKLRARIDAKTEQAMAVDNPLDRQKRLRKPFVIASPVPFDTVACAEERAAELAGLVVEVGFERSYPFGAVGGQIVGYTAPLGAAETAALAARGELLDAAFWREADLDRFVEVREGARLPDDRAGRAGVEASYDPELAGAAGARLVERDRRTRELRVIEEEPPVAGADVTLTIDIDFQRAAEEDLDRAVLAANGGEDGGALVVLDPRTGGVLALATAPRYDPNAVRRDFAALAQARPSPLLDRPLAAALPPGSTMKPLVASAALEEGIAFEGRPLSPETTLLCRGYLHDPRQKTFHCDGIHGQIALGGALAQSCNVYFFLLGEQLGENGLGSWAARFGLGRRTGIDLPGEEPGLFPSGAWKERRLGAARDRVARGERGLARARADLLGALVFPGAAGGIAAPLAAAEVASREARLEAARDFRRRAAADAAWGVGDSRNSAIGQGNVLATPIQIACVAATIAAGGRRVVPHVALAPARRFQREAEDVGVAPRTLAAVRAGMRAVVTAGHGTAREAGLEPFGVAGKTGTAQGGPKGDHAWFMGFAPADAPEVAFACVVEHVRPRLDGGHVAAPAIARVLAVRAGAAARGGGARE